MAIRSLRLAFLWLALVVGMSLHASYDLSALRYGVDVVIEGSTGSVPWSNVWLKSIFYVLPLLMAVGVAHFASLLWRRFHFAMALAFFLSNVAHLAKQGFRSGEPLEVAQTILLTAMVLISIPLAVGSYRHMRDQDPTETTP